MPVWPPKRHRASARLWVAVSLVFLGGLGAHLVQTDFGRVQVLGLTFPTTNGQWVAADLFKPRSASASNPVPLVVVCPGFERSKETMAGFSIELARRGMAVIVIDPYNQGASSGTGQRRSASREGYGVVPVVEALQQSPAFDFVDKTRVGAAGYSAGGNAVLQSASLFGARQARALRRARRQDSPGGRTVTAGELAAAHAENKLSAVFVGGYVLSLTDEVLATVEANVGMDYAAYDEGAFRTASGHARMPQAAEALRLVNAVLPADQPLAEAELGRFYGDAGRHTLRVVHNTPNIHPVLPYDPRFVANLVTFFAAAFDLHPRLDPTNQTWWLKESFTLVSLAGLLLFPVPFAARLLERPAFRPLAQPMPPALPRPQGLGRVVFWSQFTLSATLACGLFMPLARATATLFPAASAAQPTWWFPQRINNAILLWAVANGLLGLGVFALNHGCYGRRHGATPAHWGLRLSARALGRTVLLALLVLAGFYALLFANYALFHTDARFLFIAASAAIPPRMPLVALEYLPLFFIFYFANSVRVNAAGRFAGQAEWVSRWVQALGNSVGLLLILLIQYGWLAHTGRVFWTDGWLYVNLLLGVIPMMFVLPFYQRAFFHLTGTVWLGPMVTCLVFVLMLLTNNVCYIPWR